MKLNKETQYAILFVLYIARAGRATVETAAENLTLSKSFLQQVARRLKIRSIIKSVRGPGGGYELIENVRMLDVINSIPGNGLLDQEDRNRYISGKIEERALELYVSNIGMAMWPILNRRVKSVMQELIINETAQLNRLTTDGIEQ